MSEADKMYAEARKAHNEMKHKRASELYRQAITEYAGTEAAGKAARQLKWLMSGLDEGTSQSDSDSSQTSRKAGDDDAPQMSRPAKNRPPVEMGSVAENATLQSETSRPDVKFKTLRGIAEIFKALAFLYGCGGLLASIILFSDRGFGFGLVTLVGTVFPVVLCLALGESIRVVLAIEENTRRTALQSQRVDE